MSFSGLVCLKSFVGAFNWTSTWLFYMLFCIHLPCRHLHISGNHFINIEILISTRLHSFNKIYSTQNIFRLTRTPRFYDIEQQVNTPVCIWPPPPSFMLILALTVSRDSILTQPCHRKLLLPAFSRALYGSIVCMLNTASDRRLSPKNYRPFDRVNKTTQPPRFLESVITEQKVYHYI